MIEALLPQFARLAASWLGEKSADFFARGARFTRTIKVGTGIVRAEFEEELPKPEFARRWPLTLGSRPRSLAK
jgi:hypothetical protein